MANISIEIISVGQPSAVKTYKVIEVAYKKDGKIEGKKIMSFTNPGVFAAIQKLTPGQVVSVGLEKNDAGYWQWVSIGAVEATSAPVGATAVASAPARSSNYETSEERANRQILIVRQSSLGHAVATLSVGSKGVKGGDVIALAEQYAHYVLNGDTDKRESLDIFEDDTPL